MQFLTFPVDIPVGIVSQHRGEGEKAEDGEHRAEHSLVGQVAEHRGLKEFQCSQQVNYLLFQFVLNKSVIFYFISFCLQQINYW